MTVPRTVDLAGSSAGVELRQWPIAALDDRRREHRRYAADGVEAIAGDVAADAGGEVLDLVLSVEPGSAEAVGVRVAVGADAETVIRYEPATAILSLDRQRSGDVGFAGGFGAVHSAPLPLADGRLDLRIVLDRSSVEVFAEGGRLVVTDLLFPPPDARGIDVFADGGATGPVTLDVWDLGG